MFSLYLSLAALGLSAIDPVGIGIMPVLLLQKYPYKRIFVFLGGSFVSLMAMGLLYALGIGAILLRFEHANPWIIPAVERGAGCLLLLVALVSYLRLRKGNSSMELPKNTRGWLQRGNGVLFLLGALLVAVQSIIDVVFVVAMVRIGQYNLTGLRLIGAVAIYASTALVIQLAVVLAFRLAPPNHKKRTLDKVHQLVTHYSSQVLIGISLLLGVVLLVSAR